jgi:hypothetical protein
MANQMIGDHSRAPVDVKLINNNQFAVFMKLIPECPIENRELKIAE